MFSFLLGVWLGYYIEELKLQAKLIIEWVRKWL